jgi:hypothetical protein
MFERRDVQGHVEGRRLDRSDEARHDPRLSLALRDLSAGGLSAMSQRALSRGEGVAVFFPPQGARRGWDAYGRVIRCQRGGTGYRVAVEFEALPVAA